MPQLEEEYIKTGKVKYVIRDFPLESIHKNAFKAAEAVRCAREQDKGWEMYGRLFTNQQKLESGDLAGHAEAVGLNMQQFQACLESGHYAEQIRKDIAEGQAAGVTGTPAFFLGVTEPNNGKVKALRRITGAQAYNGFKAAIDDLLAEQK